MMEEFNSPYQNQDVIISKETVIPSKVMFQLYAYAKEKFNTEEVEGIKPKFELLKISYTDEKLVKPKM